MSKSNLVNVNVPAYAGNYTIGRDGRKIEMITIHHMAGILSAEQCGAIFQGVGRQASSHYGIGSDGRVGQYVDESNTAWSNSNWDANCKAVTIETSNCEIGGNWTVSDASLNSLIRLVADICKRNNLGTLVKGKNVTWHSMYASTSCPGGYLLSKMDYIVAEANKINNAQPTTLKYKVGDKVRVSSYYYTSVDPVEKAIIKNATGTITRVLTNGCHNPYLLNKGDLGWCNDGDIRELLSTAQKDLKAVALDVYKGKYGNGIDRKINLSNAGYTDTEITQIQAIVNNMYK